LAGLFLQLLDSRLQQAQDLADALGQRAGHSAGRGLDGAQNAGQQNLAGRQFSQGLDFVGV